MTFSPSLAPEAVRAAFHRADTEALRSLMQSHPDSATRLAAEDALSQLDRDRAEWIRKNRGRLVALYGRKEKAHAS